MTRNCAPGRLLQTVDRRDARMIQRGEHVRLALEARHALGIMPNLSETTLIATSRPSYVSRAR